MTQETDKVVVGRLRRRAYLKREDNQGYDAAILEEAANLIERLSHPTPTPSVDGMRELLRERMVEAAVAARFRDVPGQWPDGFTDGGARIERMLAERMIDAALRSGSEGEAWRTIDSAPKDGTKFDAWTTASRRITPVWWNASSKSWNADLGPREPYELTEHLTHWMPTPDAPASTTSKGEGVDG